MRYKIGDYVKTRDKFDTTNINGLEDDFIQLRGVIDDIRESYSVGNYRYVLSITTMLIGFREEELEEDIEAKIKMRNEKLKSLGI